MLIVIAGRNLRSDGKSESAYCTVDLPGNKTGRTSANKHKEPVWNESFNLYVEYLDRETRK
jgi:Ca2+-dependent lipid-binding protein